MQLEHNIPKSFHVVNITLSICLHSINTNYFDERKIGSLDSYLSDIEGDINIGFLHSCYLENEGLFNDKFPQLVSLTNLRA